QHEQAARVVVRILRNAVLIDGNAHSLLLLAGMASLACMHEDGMRIDPASRNWRQHGVRSPSCLTVSPGKDSRADDGACGFAGRIDANFAFRLGLQSCFAWIFPCGPISAV